MAVLMRPITNEKPWEAFIRKHAPAALFQSWAWGETQEKLGDKIFRLGFYKQSKLIGLALIIKVPARRGVHLHVRHGPILVDYSARTLRSVIRPLMELARKEGAWFLRISPLLEPSDALQVRLKTLGFRPAAIHAMDAEHTLMLDLTKSEQELLSGMRKTTRYEIRRAKNESRIEIRRTNDVSVLHDFFRLYTATSKRKGFVKHTGIREEFESFVSKDQAVLFTGSFDGTVSAVALILFYQNAAIYHHGASVHTKVPLTHLLQWKSIQYAKKRGSTWYNFFGISDVKNKHHPWYGTTIFKRGFGGEERNYLHAQDLPMSPLYLLTRTIETTRRIKRGY